MQLAPGPIPAITSSWYDSSISDPGNVATVTAFNTVFDPLLAQMDATIDFTQVIDFNLPDDGNDDDVAAINASLGAIAGADTTADQFLGDSQVADLSGQMLIAYSVTPQEAFQPVPPQLIAAPGAPPVIQQAQAQAGISNLTRPGDTNFYPGDSYQIDVTLQPVPGGGGQFQGVGVLLFISQGSTSWPNINLCETDQYGHLAWQGVFQQTDVGDWMAVAEPGGVAVPGALPANAGEAEVVGFNWVVTNQNGPQPGALDPAPAGATGLIITQTAGVSCVTSTVSVTLTNLSNPGEQNFLSGDTWELQVTGPPNSSVTIWASQNGQPLGSEVLGQTDANGVFTLPGSMSDPYIGFWVENYMVGDQVWTGTLTFNVSAQPPPPPTSPLE